MNLSPANKNVFPVLFILYKLSHNHGVLLKDIFDPKLLNILLVSCRLINLDFLLSYIANVDIAISFLLFVFEALGFLLAIGFFFLYFKQCNITVLYLVYYIV